MEYILLSRVFADIDKDFSFPQDFSLLIEKGVSAFLAVKLEPNYFDWLEIEVKILTNAMIANKSGLSYEINKDPEVMDPYEWALHTANKEKIWIKKEDISKFVSKEITPELTSPETAIKKMSNGLKSENKTIEILSATIQTLVSHLIDVNKESHLLKEEKGSYWLHIDNISQEIVDHSLKWWKPDDRGVLPTGAGSRNIKDKISAALKFTTSA